MPSSIPEPYIVQWLVDTRPLWPVRERPKPKDEVAELKTAASQVLALLSVAEQDAVLKYYHIRDAKTSLASQLLKHLVITKHCNIPWSKSTISRPTNGKPCYIPVADEPHIEFNVSHQAGLVTLIAVVGGDGRTNVGTDIVCANERLLNDYKNIEKSGFYDWIDMHGEVFADSEVNFMKSSTHGLDQLVPESPPICDEGNDALSKCQWRHKQVELTLADGENDTRKISIDSNLVIDAKLRRFYAMWCLREAYVKMTGEALLAPWLKDLQICDVRAPSAAAVNDPESLKTGELVYGYRIIFKGEEVTNVQMALVALGSHYMVGGAVRTTDTKARLGLGLWDVIHIEEEVLKIGESIPS